jgi:hypothetical protein
MERFYKEMRPKTDLRFDQLIIRKDTVFHHYQEKALVTRSVEEMP